MPSPPPPQATTDTTKMKYGLIIPTPEEAVNVPADPGCVIAGGYGAGKAAGCAAAAELIFLHGCRTILLWGSVGATYGSGLRPGDILVGSRVAYRDYDLRPVLGCTRIGEVPDYTPGWGQFPEALAAGLRNAVKTLFPDNFRDRDFPLASGDIFCIPEAEDANGIEADAMIYDMEAAAVLHFCTMLNRKANLDIQVGMVKVITNLPQDENCDDFAAAAEKYCTPLNRAIPDIIRLLN